MSEAMTGPDALPDPAALARVWIEELRRAERGVEAWHRRGDKVVRRYKDERDAAAVDERRGLSLAIGHRRPLRALAGGAFDHVGDDAAGIQRRHDASSTIHSTRSSNEMPS